MVPDFERAGLQFVGKDESGRRMEVDLEFFLDTVDLQLVPNNSIQNFLHHLTDGALLDADH